MVRWVTEKWAEKLCGYQAKKMLVAVGSQRLNRSNATGVSGSAWEDHLCHGRKTYCKTEEKDKICNGGKKLLYWQTNKEALQWPPPRCKLPVRTRSPISISPSIYSLPASPLLEPTTSTSAKILLNIYNTTASSPPHSPTPHDYTSLAHRLWEDLTFFSRYSEILIVIQCYRFSMVASEHFSRNFSF